MKLLVFISLVFIAQAQNHCSINITNGYDFFKFFRSSTMNQVEINDTFPDDVAHLVGNLPSSNFWFIHNQNEYISDFESIPFNVVGATFLKFSMTFFVIDVNVVLFFDDFIELTGDSETGKLNSTTEYFTYSTPEFEQVLDFSLVTVGERSTIFIFDEITLVSDGPLFCDLPETTTRENTLPDSTTESIPPSETTTSPTTTTTTIEPPTTSTTTAPPTTTTERISTSDPLPECPPYEIEQPPIYFPGISCDSYYMCSSEGEITLIYCPRPLFWNQSIRACVHPGSVICDM